MTRPPAYGTHTLYADPGYREDGRKRYPVDTPGHILAGWSYIHMRKNQKFYTAAQVGAIKNRIKAAAKELDLVTKEYDEEEDLRLKPTVSRHAKSETESKINEEDPRLPSIQLMRAYADLAGLPIFEISTEHVRGYAVYVLLDENCQPLYVGQSRSILGRLNEHLRNAEKGGRTTTMQFVKCHSKEHMDEVELRLIQLYNPPFNIVGRTA